MEHDKLKKENGENGETKKEPNNVSDVVEGTEKQKNIIITAPHDKK